jgi:hypothetical protein
LRQWNKPTGTITTINELVGNIKCLVGHTCDFNVKANNLVEIQKHSRVAIPVGLL